MLLPISSTISTSWMLFIVLLYPMWGKYMYMWYPSHPRHLMGFFLCLFPKVFDILDSFCVVCHLEIIFEEMWIESFPSLIHISFIFFNPISLKGWSPFMLIIKALGSPYGFLQCLGLIILYLITVYWRYPTQKY